MALYGTDQSHYQAVGNYPGDFVILKATEGTTIVDPKCDQHYQSAKSQGKLLGIYHYADFGDPATEANYFVDNCTGYIGSSILALDVETTANVSWALAWLNQVYARTQVRAFVYMSASTCKAADWTPVYKAGYALWAAGYPTKFNVANPPTPLTSGSDMPYNTGAWPFATIWQYSSSAGTLDRDIFYGSATAWDKFAEGDRDVTPTPPPTAPTVPDTPPTSPTQESPTPAEPTVPTPAPSVPQGPESPPGAPVNPTTPPVIHIPAPVESDPQAPVAAPQPPALAFWNRLMEFFIRIFK